jgi:hypothetical protein
MKTGLPGMSAKYFKVRDAMIAGTGHSFQSRCIASFRRFENSRNVEMTAGTGTARARIFDRSAGAETLNFEPFD